MSVWLPNTQLGLRRRVEAPRNAHGQRMPDGWGQFLGPHDGRTKENADGSWNLGVDPDLWPVRQGDLIISTGGGSWLVQTAAVLRNNYDPTVDWVRATGLHRTTDGTEPGGPWYVGRFTDYAEPPPPTPGPPVYEAGAWTGYGPPPEASAEFAPEPGDEYIDLLTGLVYVFGATP